MCHPAIVQRSSVPQPHRWRNARAAEVDRIECPAAARTGAVAALHLLIERGAAVDAREPEFQQTALMIAVREDHRAAVELLVKAGAAVNAQTRKGPDAG
jgi:ankyrin repeat protein